MRKSFIVVATLMLLLLVVSFAGCKQEPDACAYCGGSGDCQSCAGNGTLSAGTVLEVDCPLCDEGKCPECDGSGEAK